VSQERTGAAAGPVQRPTITRAKAGTIPMRELPDQLRDYHLLTKDSAPQGPLHCSPARTERGTLPYFPLCPACLVRATGYAEALRGLPQSA
jgi:hypothetical protein